MAEDLHNQTQPKEVKRSEQRDYIFADLARTEGWRRLKEIIEGYVENLEENVNVQSGDSVQTVGFKYLAMLTAKDHLQSLVDLVEQSREVVDERNEE